MKLGIVNYGMGNMHSIKSAFKHLNCNDIIEVTTIEQLKLCDKVVLPGVGSYGLATKKLNELDLRNAIIDYAEDLKRPILGICLGMQLMGASSTEEGKNLGLGLIGGEVTKFIPGAQKIPHVGFNEVLYEEGSVLFSKFEDKKLDFYFTHSYCMKSSFNTLNSICTYGEKFIAAYEKENIFGTQFHPELSQSNGLKLLQNFLDF